jgi:hypothetical protein
LAEGPQALRGGIKRKIREAAETGERLSYERGRMPAAWLEALAPLGTDWHKPFLETVSWIVVVFEEIYQVGTEGQRLKSYYGKESVGIACGLFVAALHVMGLATLTHTPSPMVFLSKILGRPKNERPFVLFPIGYPADDATVPDLTRKSLDEVAVWALGPSLPARSTLRLLPNCRAISSWGISFSSAVRASSASPLAPAAFTLVREAYRLRVEKVIHILRDELVVIDADGGQSGDSVEAAKPERIELREGLVVLHICSAGSADGLFVGEQRISPRPAGLAGQSFGGQVMAQVV